MRYSRASISACRASRAGDEDLVLSGAEKVLDGLLRQASWLEGGMLTGAEAVWRCAWPVVIQGHGAGLLEALYGEVGLGNKGRKKSHCACCVLVLL